MKEIEVKAKITDKDALIEKLTALGCSFSEPITQKDKIFIPLGHDIPVENGVNVFRIREQNGKYILTLKQQVTNQLDCIERELNIDNPDEMIEIIKLLGFFEVSYVNKARQKSKFKDYEICLDEIDGLGSFIEVEKLSEDGDANVIQVELFNFLESLGIPKQNQVTDGYDILLKQRTEKGFN